MNAYALTPVCVVCSIGLVHILVCLCFCWHCAVPPRLISISTYAIYRPSFVPFPHILSTVRYQRRQSYYANCVLFLTLHFSFLFATRRIRLRHSDANLTSPRSQQARQRSQSPRRLHLDSPPSRTSSQTSRPTSNLPSPIIIVVKSSPVYRLPLQMAFQRKWALWNGSQGILGSGWERL